MKHALSVGEPLIEEGGWYRDAWTLQFCICVFCMEMGVLLWVYSSAPMYIHTQHYLCMYAFSHSAHFSLIL